MTDKGWIEFVNQQTARISALDGKHSGTDSTYGKRRTVRRNDQAGELIKGKVLETAPLTSREAAEAIAEAVHAEVVQVIGRTFVLYRRNPKEPKIQLP